MIIYADEALFKSDECIISHNLTDGDDVNISNAELCDNNLNLHEAICSEAQLRFGACESSCLKFTTYDMSDALIGKTLTYTMTPAGSTTPLRIGKYRVTGNTLDSDGLKRNVTAWDDMKRILSTDLTAWYEALTFPMTIKNFRDALATALGVTQETTTLVNDDIIINRTVSGTTSGGDWLPAVCEINGVFGHIGRDDKLHYVKLPRSNTFEVNASEYSSFKKESVNARGINKLIVRAEESDIGATAGTGTNTYVVQGNILVLGLNAATLQTVANNLYSQINGLPYRPLSLEVYGDPCVEVGDAFTVTDANNATYSSFVLERTLSGIQAMVDKYQADGSEYIKQPVLGINAEFKNIKGRVNRISTDVEGIKAEIEEFDQDYATKTELQALAGTIDAKVSKTDGSGTSNAQWNMDATTGITMDTHGTTNGIALKSNGNTVLEINRDAATFSGTVYANDGVFNGTVGANGITTGTSTKGILISNGTIESHSTGASAELFEGGLELRSKTNPSSNAGARLLRDSAVYYSKLGDLAKARADFASDYIGLYGDGDNQSRKSMALTLTGGAQFVVRNDNLSISAPAINLNGTVNASAINEGGTALVNKYAPLQSALSGRGRWYTMDNPVSGYARINLNLTAHSMFNLTMKIYSAYHAYDLQVSGYYYVGSSNPFYTPNAVLLASSQGDGIAVYLGFNSDGTLYIAVPANAYFAVQITDALTGYIPTGNVDIISSVVIEPTLSGTVAWASALYPPRGWTDCGAGTINSDTFTRIYFNREFPRIPKVVATYVQSSWPSGQIGAIKINNVTTTGFDATVSGSWSGDVGINWIAMA